MQELPDILNWRRWSELITLSGQPTEAQLAQIRNLGVTHIINLGPHDNKGALDDEPGAVSALGMEYIYIPVDFGAPAEKDFNRFQASLAQLGDCRIHVHCIYNARVSAFFYRHARAGHGGSETAAFALMDSIWRPGGVWAAFIGHDADCDQPNRYAGHEY